MISSGTKCDGIKPSTFRCRGPPNSRLRRGREMLLCLIWLSLRRGWYVSLLLSFPPFPPLNRLWVFPNSSLHSPQGGREEVHSAAPHRSSGNRRASEQACGHMCAGVCVSAIYSRHPTSVFALLCLASPPLHSGSCDR